MRLQLIVFVCILPSLAGVLLAQGPVACAETHTIAQVQGDGDLSPLAGQTVTVSGVTTVLRSNGFYLQMTAGDGDPSTSDGIFVYTGGAPPAAAVPGNELCVTGPVSEFAPSSDPASLTLTEINRPSKVVLLTTGNALPLPVIITAADTDPAGALDALEKYEGMLVRVDTLLVTGPTQGRVDERNALATSTGLFLGVLPGIARPFREPGVQLPDPLPAASPCCVTRFDGNPEVLSVDSSRLPQPLNVTSGATVRNLVGALDYTERTYEIVLPSDSGAAACGNRAATPIPDADDAKLRIASFNMQRFFDTADNPSVSDVVLTADAFGRRLNKASLAIRTILRLPDIIGVQEMENLAALQALAQKISDDAAAAGQLDPHYQSFLL